jgi:predicted unusual protein kinase regulating ubiquinone biosynthesis (AarF/ABC1/UbiB family)
LVEALKVLLSEKPIQVIRSDVESIKINFYKKHKAEVEKKRKEFVEAGGNIEQFTAPEDLFEPQIKELLKEYRESRSKYNKDFEVQKHQNLIEKQKIIETIKELVNKSDSVSQTFQEFRELQQRWREIGPVPQSNLNDLWETYHHHVQNFYDFVKINKELRDLDLKRNLEEKIVLCEKAEELLLESSVIVAFKKLQKYHNQWREVGPVPKEHRTEIWERLREATAKINKKHQEYFEGLRD